MHAGIRHIVSTVHVAAAALAIVATCLVACSTRGTSTPGDLSATDPTTVDTDTADYSTPNSAVLVSPSTVPWGLPDVSPSVPGAGTAPSYPITTVDTPQPTGPGTIPSGLVGLNLSLALDLLNSAGFHSVVPVSDTGKMVLMPTHWTVIAVQPDEGSTVALNTEVDILVTKTSRW